MKETIKNMVNQIRQTDYTSYLVCDKDLNIQYSKFNILEQALDYKDSLSIKNNLIVLKEHVVTTLETI